MKPSFFLQILEILFLLSLVAFKDNEILTFLHVMCHHKVELSPHISSSQELRHAYP